MGRGVIVYGNFIKVGLGTTKNGSVYGLAPKKNPLVPAHRIRPARKVGERIGEQVGEQVGERWPALAWPYQSTYKVGELITNIMLSRNAMHCIPILYILSLSSICTVLLSCNNILGFIISMAILLRLPSIFDSIFCVGRPM